MYYDPFFAAAAASQAVVNDPNYRLQVCTYLCVENKNTKIIRNYVFMKVVLLSVQAILLAKTQKYYF